MGKRGLESLLSQTSLCLLYFGYSAKLQCETEQESAMGNSFGIKYLNVQLMAQSYGPCTTAYLPIRCRKRSVIAQTWHMTDL